MSDDSATRLRFPVWFEAVVQSYIDAFADDLDAADAPPRIESVPGAPELRQFNESYVRPYVADVQEVLALCRVPYDVLYAPSSDAGESHTRARFDDDGTLQEADLGASEALEALARVLDASTSSPERLNTLLSCLHEEEFPGFAALGELRALSERGPTPTQSRLAQRMAGHFALGACDVEGLESLAEALFRATSTQEQIARRPLHRPAQTPRSAGPSL